VQEPVAATASESALFLVPTSINGQEAKIAAALYQECFLLDDARRGKSLVSKETPLFDALKWRGVRLSVVFWFCNDALNTQH